MLTPDIWYYSSQKCRKKNSFVIFTHNVIITLNLDYCFVRLIKYMWTALIVPAIGADIYPKIKVKKIKKNKERLGRSWNNVNLLHTFLPTQKRKANEYY